MDDRCITDERSSAQFVIQQNRLIFTFYQGISIFMQLKKMVATYIATQLSEC